MQTLERTKAAMQGRLCHYLKLNQTQHTRLVACGQRTSQCNSVRDFESYLAFLRWRRLISLNMAALINCPVLSPELLTFSMPSMISCAIRAVTDCDFAFFGPVAISASSDDWCKTIYTDFHLLKDLTCKTPFTYIVSYTLIHLRYKNSEAPQMLATSAGPLTKPLIEVTVMAGSQHTQTHPEFTWHFLALSATESNVIHITATTESEAREQSPAGCVMVFAGRLPNQGELHV